MEIIADFHLHSKYSRAVSQEMNLPSIWQWAAQKGINLVGTGDFTHPLWLREIKANLEEKGEGIYRLKTQNEKDSSRKIYFILTTEISSIYSQGGKLRRIHNLILAPSIKTVEKINKSLTVHGANLISDGRPVVGLSAKDLAKLVLEADEQCLIIPAHIWTPHFSLFGSESGFDSIEECFGVMEKYIYAIETGLSSDPAMNWRISQLDNRRILSFSDAHSGAKLGREATVFRRKNQKEDFSSDDNLEISYQEVFSTIRGENSQWEIGYTIEFYPEEGKYHFSGHRDCQVRQSPEETKKLGEVCPVCGKHLTIGVMHRVEQLATRQIQNEELKIQKDELGVKWISWDGRPSYLMLVPLQEILAESLGGLVGSQKIINEYKKLTKTFRGEFGVLLKTPLEKIKEVSGEKVSEGIKKVRGGEIMVEPGYDGVFGIVKIWPDKSSINQSLENKKQMSLF